MGQYGGRGLPKRTVVVDPFVIDRTEVTRSAYHRFLRDTGYRIPHVAEDWAKDGWNWTQADEPPENPSHPVVMVSFYDAREYCRWRSMRLPTEAEWQLAALGPAHENRTFPWGNLEKPKGKHFMNIFQGNFPTENTNEDGYGSTGESLDKV